MICPQCNIRKLRVHERLSKGRVTCNCKPGIDLHYVKLEGYDKAHQVATAEKAVLKDEATCLHHPDRQATALCDRCGILMCGYCQTDHQDQSLCLSCFSVAHKETLPVTVDSLGAESTRHDRIALALSTLPNLMIWPGLVCAPLSLYTVIRHWKEYPYSILPHSRANLIWALIFSILTLLGWLGIFLLIALEAL